MGALDVFKLLKRPGTPRQVAVVALAAIGLAAVVGAGFTAAPWILPSPQPPPSDVRDEASLRTGVVVVRLNKTQCRRMTFDNESGSFREGAIAACEEPPSTHKGIRIDSIRDALKRKESESR